MLLGLLLLLASAAPPPALEVEIEGLRSERGQLRLCLTRQPRHFPDCKSDPAARKASAAAGSAGPVRFAALDPGDYALSVIHDENGNGRLDSFAGIPREGFGFSRNPAIRFGPPRFEEARFAFGGAPARQTVRLRYIL